MTQPLRALPLLDGGALITGHAGDFRNRRFELMQRVSDSRMNILRISMMGMPVVCAIGPDVMHEVLVEKWKPFAKTIGIRTLLYPLAGEGLFTSGGDLWRRQRKLMAPLFQPSFVESYMQGMIACIDQWISKRRDGEVIEIGHEMTRITMNIIARSLFDADTDDDAQELAEAIDIVMRDLSAQAATVGLILKMQSAAVLEGLEGRLPSLLEGARTSLLGGIRSPSSLPTRSAARYRGAVQTLNRLVDKTIHDRRSAGLSRNDLLTKLLAARDEDDGHTMSDQQVRDEVLTLFFAGHETTAVALLWTLYAMTRSPDVARRVEEEALALPKDPETPHDLTALPCTLRTFKEALRLYPPAAMFDRIATEDVEVAGYHLPKGTNVFMFPYATHRRADLWPDPLKFDPDRFLPEVEKERPRLAWVPFGAGPRICLGMHFALVEGQLALAKMLRRLRFTPLSDRDLALGTSATSRPDEPFTMRISLRA